MRCFLSSLAFLFSLHLAQSSLYVVAADVFGKDDFVCEPFERTGVFEHSYRLTRFTPAYKANGGQQNFARGQREFEVEKTVSFAILLERRRQCVFLNLGDGFFLA